MRRFICIIALAITISIATKSYAAQVVVYSNLGPGDSFGNSVHDVLNMTSYLSHAAGFLVSPGGSNFLFTSIDLVIQENPSIRN